MNPWDMIHSINYEMINELQRAKENLIMYTPESTRYKCAQSRIHLLEKLIIITAL